MRAAALNANAQTVMISYSSWTMNGKPFGKMHGNRALITGAIKHKLNFDGLVVSDWNAIEQVPGCKRDHCPQAINAGIDVFMVPDDWKAFIANTVADVKEGRVPMSRIIRVPASISNDSSDIPASIHSQPRRNCGRCSEGNATSAGPCTTNSSPDSI